MNVQIFPAKDRNTATFIIAAADSRGKASADYVCDGLHDQDTIQDVIDALPVGGGRIILLEGNYYLSNLIDITRHSVELVGQGRGTKLIAAAGSETIDMISMGDGESQYDWIYLGHFLLSSTNQKTGGRAVVMDKMFGVWMDNVHMEKQYRGVDCINTHEWTYKSSDIRDTKENGIVIDTDFRAAVEWHLLDLWFDNPAVDNVGTGIWYRGGEGLYVQDVTIQNYVTGFMVAPPDGKEARWAFIESLLVDTCDQNGIVISQSGDGATVGINFVDCWTSTCGWCGMWIEHPDAPDGKVEGIRIIGHRAVNNGLAGIRLESETVCEIHISDSDIMSNSISSYGARHGIEVGAGVSEWSVHHCRIGNGYDGGASQGFGVWVDVGASDFYAIEHSDLRGNTVGAINDGGTGVNKRIQDNFT